MNLTQSVSNTPQTLPCRPLEPSHNYPAVLYLESIDLPVKPTASDALVGFVWGVLQHRTVHSRVFVLIHGARV